MKNTFLITGATGFIGANLVRTLVRQHHKVNIVVRNKKLNWRLSDIAHKLSIYECDIQSEKLHKIVQGIKPDYIFHCAVYGGMPQEDDIYKMIDVNLKGTINLINSLKQNTFKLFINASSSGEYGVKETEMRETDILEPINDYGVTKSATTLYCHKEAVRSKLPIISFRMFTPYGYFEGGMRLIPDVTMSAICGKPINVSSPSHVRDFIFIEDVIEAYIRATKIKHKPGEVYNIGSGTQHSVKDIVSKLLKITNSRSHVKWGAVKKQERYIEPKNWQANISKTKRVLNWKPQHTIETGLEKTVEWFREHNDLYEKYL